MIVLSSGLDNQMIPRLAAFQLRASCPWLDMIQDYYPPRLAFLDLDASNQ
jgi:hypothetical protein